MPGDYSLPHSDTYENRSVAFIWHLTRNWNPKWGGDLCWCNPWKRITPRFNALYLFNVTVKSFHFVSNVAPIAISKRMTVSGWWTSLKPNKSKPKVHTHETSPLMSIKGKRILSHGTHNNIKT